LFPDERKDDLMVEYNDNSSPNIVGLLIGLISIPVLFGAVVGVIWVLSMLVAFLGQWSAMM